MLPVARSADGALRRRVESSIFRRRAWRILPPYYATLVCLAALIALIPGLPWELSFAAWTPGVIASHLFLLHNLRSSWTGKIDPPMWSVATEWQIYFVFALFLLPLWRRFGNALTMLAAFGLGLAPHFLLPGRTSTGQARGTWPCLRWEWPGPPSAFPTNPDWLPSVNTFRGGGCASLSSGSSHLSAPAPSLPNFALLARGPRGGGGDGQPDHLLYALPHGRPPASGRTASSGGPSCGCPRHVFLQPVFGALSLADPGAFAAAQIETVADGMACHAVLCCLSGHDRSCLPLLAFEKPFLLHRKKETFVEVARDAALSPAP